MSDRQADVLASIDTQLNRCICGTPLPTDGPSLDYCSEDCQEGWYDQRTRRVSVAVPLRNGAAAADAAYIAGVTAWEGTFAFQVEQVGERTNEIMRELAEGLQEESDRTALGVVAGDRADAYAEAAVGDIRTAITAAQYGVEPASLRAFLAEGMTPQQLGVIVVSTPDADGVVRFLTEAAKRNPPADARSTT